jgi:hypothetical protein
MVFGRIPGINICYALHSLAFILIVKQKIDSIAE